MELKNKSCVEECMSVNQWIIGKKTVHRNTMSCLPLRYEKALFSPEFKDKIVLESYRVGSIKISARDLDISPSILYTRRYTGFAKK